MPEIPDPLEEVDLSKEEPLDDFPEGAGVGLTEEEARDILENLSEDDGPPLPPPLHAPDDGYSPSKEEAESQDAEEEKEGEEAQEEEADDEEEALPNRGPQEGDWEFEYSDLKEPLQSDRLMFCVPLLDNKSPCVLEALQEIYLYLRALNLPVLRLHTDRLLSLLSALSSLRASRKRHGVVHRLEEDEVFELDPKRHHFVTPFKGTRVVVIGYTSDVLGKAEKDDLDGLADLGFPLPDSAYLQAPRLSQVQEEEATK
ncbi:unnamed protein product, partial [Symbiodinium sp. CCMP2456]